VELNDFWQGITFNLLILNIDRGTAIHPVSTTSNSAYPSSRNVALHELRIKTVTTTISDPPDQFQPSKSRRSRIASRKAPDEESLDDLTDDNVEKAIHLSPSSAETLRKEPHAL
jgi:hypothetical protein